MSDTGKIGKATAHESPDLTPIFRSVRCTLLKNPTKHCQGEVQMCTYISYGCQTSAGTSCKQLMWGN